jgi:uncharacterized protein (TIGR00369 family)
VTKPTVARSRTITWEDPVPAAEHRLDLSGLDHLNAIRESRLPPPPMATLMGFDLVEADAGRVVFAVTPEEFHYNPIGVVHSATGCAVQSTLDAGVVYTSLEVKVNFARAITRDTGRVLCEGTVIHRGRTIATAEARLFAEATGRLHAHGTATCLLMPANGRAA